MTQNELKLREIIEQAILSTCLFGNSYQHVSDILHENCFSKETKGISHKNIWRCFKELYPNKPIDLISVSHKYIQLFPKEQNLISIAITEIYSNVYAIANQRYWAFLLLEEIFREKVMDIIITIDDENTELKLQKEQIYKALESRMDIFLIIEASINVFDKIGNDKYVKEFLNLNTMVEKQIKHIKKTVQLDCLITNLENFSEIDSRGKDRIKTLTDEIKRIVIFGK